MKYINETFDEERALYGIEEAEVIQCVFDGPEDGESALKECKDIMVNDCFFNLRYPFWHVENATIKGSRFSENCRAAFWQDDSIHMDNCIHNGIKAFRECSSVRIENSSIHSKEFLWRCKDVYIENVDMDSEYPLFECKYVTINQLKLIGKYSFQYVENMTITNSILDTKDAFWHGKNITIKDSTVKGEYLGWYSENLTFIRCHIIGTQPLCYCKNLILEDCIMEDTDLSFERSEVNATVKGINLGIKNPKSGKIKADRVKDLLIESKYVNEKDTILEIDTIGE